MEVRDKNIFKNSMNYEFKIWTREKKSNLPNLRAKLFLPDVKKKKLFQLSKISPDLKLKDPLRRRFN